MAPSSRARTLGVIKPRSASAISISQPQLNSRAFRVSKPSTLNLKAGSIKNSTKNALQELENLFVEKACTIIQVRVPNVDAQHTKSSSPVAGDKKRFNERKRLYEEVESSSEDEHVRAAARPKRVLKQCKLQLQPQLATPPLSSPEPESKLLLNGLLESFVVLHKALLSALSVYYAHHGPKNAVGLDQIAPAITRSYKKHVVQVQDLQRVLAVWEGKSLLGSKEIAHSEAPFKLSQTGLGSTARVSIDYVSSLTYNEDSLQTRYEQLVHRLSIDSTKSGTFLTQESLPLLNLHVGTQTLLHAERTTSIRNSILTRPIRPLPTPLQAATQHRLGFEPTPSSLSLSTLAISSPSNADTDVDVKPASTSLRKTSSLFDRILAKSQVAASTTQPTSAQALRRRALHRLPDLVPFLRQKQNHKLSNMFRGSVLDSPTKSRLRAKISFAVGQLVSEVRNSMSATPMGRDEIELALEVIGEMSREIMAGREWCVVFGKVNATGNGDKSAGISCITLQGEAPSMLEVGEWCKQQLSM